MVGLHPCMLRVAYGDIDSPSRYRVAEEMATRSDLPQVMELTLRIRD